ncbi:MAG: hypothetical protein AAF492_19065, partial [Verrucomicrobiota bacterium]
MIRKRIHSVLAGVLIGLAVEARAEEGITLNSVHDAAWRIEESLFRECQAALDRAMQWLAAKQGDDGSWSRPANTALSIQALARTGWEDEEALKRAGAWLLEYKGKPTPRNTASSLLAWFRMGNPQLVPAMMEARTFLANVPLDQEADPHSVCLVLEALRRTQAVVLARDE